MTTTTCPGCVGRGTGTVCAMCGGTIPPEMWRTRQDSASEYRPACADCRAGRTHTHTER